MATSSLRPEIIFGVHSWGSVNGQHMTVTNPVQAQPYIDILKAHNITTIDTSRNYPTGAPGTSEDLLGECDVSGFKIDTKVRNETGDHAFGTVLKSIDNSLVALKVPKIRVDFLHWPDRSVPLEEPLRAIDQKYREGKFEKFGISNYAAEEVEEIIKICELHGWIKPSVYQGQYNLLCRRGEEQLFPTLRAHGISFYAWSPGAGGSLKKDSSRLARKVCYAFSI